MVRGVVSLALPLPLGLILALAVTPTSTLNPNPGPNLSPSPNPNPNPNQARSAGVLLHARSWRPIVFASLLLASKVWHDVSYWNSDFSSICPMFNLRNINREAAGLDFGRALAPQPWPLSLSPSALAPQPWPLSLSPSALAPQP